jgi:hypothetical protein
MRKGLISDPLADLMMGPTYLKIFFAFAPTAMWCSTQAASRSLRTDP